MSKPLNDLTMKITYILTTCATMLMAQGVAFANDAATNAPKVSAGAEQNNFNAGQYYDSGDAKDLLKDAEPEKKKAKKTKTKPVKEKKEDSGY